MESNDGLIRTYSVEYELGRLGGARDLLGKVVRSN